MKKMVLLTFCILLATLSVPVHADWISDSKNQIEEALEPLVGDIGAGISGGLFKNACSLKFPGVEIGINANGAIISDDNDLIDGNTLLVPVATARLGLPMNMTLFARGMSYAIGDSDDSILIAGGGIKYDFIKEKTVPFTPSVSAIVAYNFLQVTDFNVNTISLGCVASKKFMIITPYMGISYNMTSSKIDTITGELNPSKNSFRIGAGADIKILPIMFISGSYTNLGWDVGIGIRLGLPG